MISKQAKAADLDPTTASLAEFGDPSNESVYVMNTEKEMIQYTMVSGGGYAMDISITNDAELRIALVTMH